MRTLDECLKLADLKELNKEFNERYIAEETGVTDGKLFYERQQINERIYNLKYGIKM